MERQGASNEERDFSQGESLTYHSLKDMAQRLVRMMTLAKQEGRPLVMALDGMPGLGKTTFVNALIEVFSRENKKVAVIHVDDFLSDNAVRYAWRKHSDIDAGTNYNVNNVRHYKLMHDVLIPIVRDGELQSERQAYDFVTDSDTKIRNDDIDKDTFVIVEGAMAVRTSSEKYYDLTVHLGGPQSLAEKQALIRNADPGADKVSRSVEEMLKSIERYNKGYREHVAEHGTLGLNILIEARENPETQQHDVQYAFTAVTPLEKISGDAR